MRLIDADDLWSEIMALPHNGDMISSEEVEQEIRDAPTVDAEIRVRCEKCVSSGGDAFGEMICQNQLCPCYGREVDHAFSCVLGERRTDGKDT